MSRHWERYIVETDPAFVAERQAFVPFEHDGSTFELLHFARAGAPAVLISQGTAGTAYVFAELGYRIWERGFAVFIMPKHGGRTLDELVMRHDAAIRRIRELGHAWVGVFAEGLGGYAAFYLALAGGPLDALVCQNAPAIVTEAAYRDAIFEGPAGRRRRTLLPVARLLSKISRRITLPIASYLDFRDMIDPSPRSHDIESKLIDTYLSDPDFDRRYPLSAILSLVDTPPPAPLEALTVPTMFIVPTRGIIPAYTRDLFARLPRIDKRLVEVDGSVFWMISHPREAAEVICSWFEQLLRGQASPIRRAFEPPTRSP